MLFVVTLGAVTAKSGMQLLLAILNNADVPRGVSVMTSIALLTHSVVQ